MLTMNIHYSIKNYYFINLLILSEDAQFSDETYFQIIVAFFNATNKVLCVGALIKPECIVTPVNCGQQLEPVSEIGVLTGLRYLKHNLTLNKIHHISRLQSSSKYYLVYVRSCI